MQGGFFLNVVIGQCSSIFQLFPSKDQPLLIWWDAFLVLDFRFHVLDSIRSFNLESDRLTSQSLDEDLHSTPQSENKMKGRFLLNVIVRQSSPVLQLLTSKDKPLLVWGNSFLVLNLGLYILDGVRGFHLKSDSLAGQRFNEDLHSSSQTKDKMKSRFLLDVIV